MSALDRQVGGSHYRQGGIQPVEFIEANGLQYLEASVVKRVTRHNQEGGKGRQDIEKAIHELQLLLELRYPPSTISLTPHVADGIKTPAPREYLRGPHGACMVCGQTDGHGGLQCPNTKAFS